MNQAKCPFPQPRTCEAAPRKLAKGDVRGAVRKTFETFGDTERINMPALVTFALQHLDTKPHEYANFRIAIEDFIRTSGEYELIRGYRGGVRQLY